MEWLTDPSIWVGLLTLIVLEVVLGIDNLVFIAILVDKLPTKQRDKARLIGLSLALLMRLGLLSVISWVVTLTTPLFSIAKLDFSGRDLILLLGGLFLLVKATMELHERLEGTTELGRPNRTASGFWIAVTQIVALDAVFSLDSVITAVGMVDELAVMIAAVVVAVAVMLVASKPLTRFVSAHPTVVMLCLSFLLMIGFSLVVEGFGFDIPKGYLYAAIGFSILIETFNQMAARNLRKHQARRPLRERTAEAILRLMGGHRAVSMTSDGVASMQNEEGVTSEESPVEIFASEERNMISGVLSLAERSLRTIMTPRTDVSWIDCDGEPEQLRTQLLDSPRNLFPVCRGVLDEVIGVVRAKDLLMAIDRGEPLQALASRFPPITVPDSIDVIRLLGVLRNSKGQLVLVTDEFGAVQGLVTPVDVLEAIAGEFPDADETADIVRDGENWLVKGSADLHLLEQQLGRGDLVNPGDEYASIAGLLLSCCGRVPVKGAVVHLHDLRFEIVDVSRQQIKLVRVSRSNPPQTDS